MQHTVPAVLQGYLYILVENMSTVDPEHEIACYFSLGQVARCNTASKKSGQAWNEVFMIQVPSEPSRLKLQFKDKEVALGECRYDVNPFFEHAGAAHAISSDFFDDKNVAQGKINLKITYYSAEYGKLKLRIFSLTLVQPFIDKFKHAKVKARIGVFAQSTPMHELGGEFDESLEMILLQPNLNLTLDVVHEEGVLATYTIYELEKSGVLKEQVKAYQVSLFNNEKAVGMIKYQVQWVKKK